MRVVACRAEILPVGSESFSRVVPISGPSGTSGCCGIPAHHFGTIECGDREGFVHLSGPTAICFSCPMATGGPVRCPISALTAYGELAMPEGEGGSHALVVLLSWREAPGSSRGSVDGAGTIGPQTLGCVQHRVELRRRILPGPRSTRALPTVRLSPYGVCSNDLLCVTSVGTHIYVDVVSFRILVSSVCRAGRSLPIICHTSSASTPR